MRKYLRDVRESQKDKTDCYSSPAVRYGENKTKWIEVKQDTSKLQKSRIALFTDNLGLAVNVVLWKRTLLHLEVTHLPGAVLLKVSRTRNTVRLVNRKRKQAELKRTYETKSTEARNVPIILFAGHFRFDRSSSPWPLAVTIDNGIVMNCGCVTLGSVWARLKMTPLGDRMGGWDVARDLEVVVAVVDGAVVVVEDVVAGCEDIEGGGVPDLDAGGAYTPSVSSSWASPSLLSLDSPPDMFSS
ncbi:hypothetical protein GEV33_006240 [Tenebrio molitor]|uniref:Uncharacterized protein n=1 Tax=Tenebrio molitor TaxID=7067 RepID=A0A8J6HM73_TENMO|nr:hypothetical protein GEV33_006240 [Tenebrio molitor]